MARLTNRELEVARRYHAATKHTSLSVRSSGHFLDWENKPFPYKVYPELPAIRLPRELPVPEAPGLRAIAEAASGEGEPALDLPRLASLLFFSAGLTKKKTYPGGETVYFRAAASTGALYEVEVYVVAGELPGLPAGVYHFCPGDFTLRRLREGDHREALGGATAEGDAVRRAPATLVLSAIFWRNTWKYQARAYRHCFWDSGTLLANLLAAAAAARLPARVLAGFLDDRVDHLLGLDGEREASLLLVPLGRSGAAPSPFGDLPPIAPATVPLSREEVDYPSLREMHVASTLKTPDELAAWPGPPPWSPGPGPHGEPVALRPIPEAELPTRSLAEVILRRGSTRQFAREAITFAQLSTILDRSTRGIPADFLGEASPGLVEIYLIAHAVEGLPAGSYTYVPAGRGLEPLRLGEFRETAGYLCLEQSLAADGSAAVFFLADLKRVLERYGNRGYRTAQLEAGTLGGKMYLAAYALGLGASGITFYDDDVATFFAPHAAGKETLFATILGRAARARGGLLGEGRVERVAPGVPIAG